MNRVWEITYSEKYIALSETQDIIHIFDLNGIYKFGFKAKYNSGGIRMAFSYDCNYFFSADYYNGLACYDLNNWGKLVWHNKSIKGILNLVYSVKFNSLLILTNKESLNEISSDSGLLINSKKGKVSDIFGSYNNIFFVRKNELIYLQEGNEVKIPNTINNLWKISCITICNEKLVYVAEFYKKLRCIDLSGNIIWQSDLKEGYLIKNIAISSDNMISLVASYSETFKNTLDYMILINKNTGKVMKMRDITGQCFLNCYSSRGDFLYLVKLDTPEPPFIVIPTNAML